ncbi:MAG: LysR family transcriptional regulator [Alphaproteobacteria bacterium]|nr:LysR family transcriptional regulator [Alphaproteobacteria bacterium]
MDNINEMQVFARVVDSGGFSSAARSLNLSPSAVSKQITRLEDRLGVRLLTRTTRRLNLTEEGDAFYHRVKRILADIDEAEQAISISKGAPRGHLRVTSSVAFGENQLAPLLLEFLDRYPEITFELVLSDGIIDLVEEGIDVAIRQGKLSNSAMVARKLADIRRRIVAAPAYIEKFGLPESPDDLHQHNCLGFAGHPYLNDWPFKFPDGRRQTVRATGNFYANNGESIYDLLMAGLGIARAAEFMVGHHIREGSLVEVLPEFLEDELTPIHAVYPDPRHLSPKTRAFIDYMVEKLTPTPPWEAY